MAITLDGTTGTTTPNVVLPGSASGTITLAAPSAAGTQSYTLPSAVPAVSGYALTSTTGGVMSWASTAPTRVAFSVYASAGQTVTTATATKVSLNTVRWDTGGYFNTTTNRFTPLVAGYYQVNFGIGASGATTMTNYYASLYKGGAEDARPNQVKLTTGVFGTSAAGGSTIVAMNGTTDYIELYGYIEGTGTLTISGGFASCFMNGFYLGTL